MKIRLLGVSIGLLLCACHPSKDREAEAVAPAPATIDAPATSSEAPAASSEATTPASEVTPTAVSATDQAVNDSIDSNLGDHTRYQAVIQQLQAAVAAGDAAKVAALAQYPFSVDIGGKATVLKNEQEFVARYQEFMTADISKAIVDTKYADLFVNYKGVMFGNGQAWINGICKDDQCKAFDVKLVTLQHGP